GGTFSAPIETTLGTGAWGGWIVTPADVNGDGKTDLIAYVTNSSDWQANVALSNGDGTFAAPVYWHAGTSGWGGVLVHTGDVDGDGRVYLNGYVASGTARSYS